MSIERTITPNPPADFAPNRQPQIELSPFRFWCQKVLPLVYDDSLSYYELLCKVVDYLNKTMEDVSKISTDMDNLYNAFNKLQDYVNNYFSSLDVQTEINNKLDQMYINGDFDAIISSLLNDKIAFSAVKTDSMTDNEALQACLTQAETLQASHINALITIDKPITITEPMTLNNTYINDATITIRGQNNCSITTNSETSIFGTVDNHLQYIFDSIHFVAGNAVELLHNYNICNSKFINCTFEGYTHVLYSPLFTQLVTFENCTFINGVGAQLYYGGSYYMRVDNCFFISCSGDYCIKQANDIAVSDSLWGNEQTVITKSTIDQCYGFLYSEAERGLYITHNGLEASDYFITLNRTKHNDIYRGLNVYINNNSFGAKTVDASPTTLKSFVTINNYLGYVTISGNLLTGLYVFTINGDMFEDKTNQSLNVYDNVYDARVNNKRVAIPYQSLSNAPTKFININNITLYAPYIVTDDFYTKGYEITVDDVTWVRCFGSLYFLNRGGSFSIGAELDTIDVTINLPYAGLYPISVSFTNGHGSTPTMVANSYYINSDNQLIVKAGKTVTGTASASGIFIALVNCEPAF